MNNTIEEARAVERRVHFYNNGQIVCGRTLVEFSTMDVHDVNCVNCMQTVAFGEACDVVDKLEAQAREEE